MKITARYIIPKKTCMDVSHQEIIDEDVQYHLKHSLTEKIMDILPIEERHCYDPRTGMIEYEATIDVDIK